MLWSVPEVGTNLGTNSIGEEFRGRQPVEKMVAGTGLNRRQQDFQSNYSLRVSARNCVLWNTRARRRHSLECAGMIRNGPELGTVWAQLPQHQRRRSPSLWTPCLWPPATSGADRTEGQPDATTRFQARLRTTVASPKSAPGQPMKSRTIRLNLSGFSMNMK
jgi:hypothetical protein